VEPEVDARRPRAPPSVGSDPHAGTTTICHGNGVGAAGTPPTPTHPDKNGFARDPSRPSAYGSGGGAASGHRRVQRSKAVCWFQTLTTIGAVLEVAGLSFTGFALWDRGERHNAPPGRLRRGYRWIDNRIRALRGQPRPQFIEPKPVGVTVTLGQPHVGRRPGEIADDAQFDEKVAWLMLYIEDLDQDGRAKSRYVTR
jgi:hypothetical protein